MNFFGVVSKFPVNFELRVGEFVSCFQKSLRNIERLNLLRGTGENSAVYGPTKFSDMSENEFLYDHLRPDLPARTRRHDQNCDYHHLHHHDHKDRSQRVRFKRELSPDRWDWREHDAVTSVKSQGNCGACWAFSSVAVAESMFAIKNGSLRNFSVQEVCRIKFEKKNRKI